MSHKQLTQQQRYHIYGLWKSGYTQTSIAKEIGVHKSTISREFKRNIFWWNSRIPQYKPDYAQAYCQGRHKLKRKRIKFTKEMASFVRTKTIENWSPEQISGCAKRHQLFTISHERIYQFILQDKRCSGNLYKYTRHLSICNFVVRGIIGFGHVQEYTPSASPSDASLQIAILGYTHFEEALVYLRHPHKKYRKRYGGPKRNGPIKNRRFIEERPTIVDEKKRIGDWEIDTIIGKRKKQAVISIVERFSKKVVLKKIEAKTAARVCESTISGLRPYANAVLTITYYGSEFSHHERIAQSLQTDFYFAHPYSSWERGLNENTSRSACVNATLAPLRSPLCNLAKPYFASNCGS